MATEKTEINDKEAPDLEDKDTGADDEDEVTAEADGQVVVRTRKEKRAERSRSRHDELLSELRKTREEAEQARREASEARALAARGYQAPPQQETAADPYKARVREIRSEQESIQVAFRTGGLTNAEDVERLRKRYYDLEDKIEDLREEKVERRLAAKMPAPRQEGEYEERVLRDEFPEVIANGQATRYAIGVYQTLVAEGKPPTLVTSREAMRKAGERFGLYGAKAPPVSDATKQKFGGVPAQAGARSGGTETRLNKAQQKMALAAYPNESSDARAFARWANMYQKSESNKE